MEGRLLIQSWPDHTWSERWCILDGNTITLYEQDKTESSSCVVHLGPCATVACRSNGADEVVELAKGHPFAFVLDLEPKNGNGESLLYFDAESEESLHEWTTAITLAVMHLDWQPGDIVKVKRACAGNSRERYWLHQGLIGFIKEIDMDGDVLIDFDGVDCVQWIFKCNLHVLERQADTDNKPVALELIPQNSVVMHWALRVGVGPTSRIYEFDQCGYCVGPQSALHKGYEIETLPLTGYTCKTHREIIAFARIFAAENLYSTVGNDDLGGKNCQDFVVELCHFLEIDIQQLPWRQSASFKVGLGAVGTVGAVAVANVTLDLGLLAGAGSIAGTVGAAIVGAPFIVALSAAVGTGVAVHRIMSEGEDTNLNSQTDC